MVGFETDCGPKCRSRQHVHQLITAITKGNLRQIQLFLCRCHNAARLSDQAGRTVMHMAASCGKWELLDWLISERSVDLTVKDIESGWTVLHRALFYGQLTSARLLISHGVSLHTRDKEGLTALDIAMKDRLPHVEFVRSGLNEAFTWGDNANFTLGHASEQRRRYPEPVEFFRRQAISIKQIVMCKYHTVFLTSAGSVYTCGHGRGGRLGHSAELTSLEPKLVVGVKQEMCVEVDASTDHTVMLMDSGCVYSCGLNAYHQLGQLPPPASALTAKMMNSKQIKGKAFTGVRAQRFHTVLYNADSIFTFGLNAGQLGHHKVSTETIVTHPRQVSALIHKEATIKLVTAADAATVVVTSRGDVYALHEYQVRRVVAKRLDIEQVCATGGHLDHHAEQDLIRDRGGHDLIIAVRTTSGKIYLWRSGERGLWRCAWVLQRPLFITSMSLSASNLAFITADGEAFLTTLSQRRRKHSVQGSGRDIYSSLPLSAKFSVTLSDLVECDLADEMNIERVAQVHRAVDIVADQKGRNFAVLQAQANASLTEIPSVQDSVMTEHCNQLLTEADTTDNIHDVILKVGAEQLPAHRFILAHRSEFFRKLFIETPQEGDEYENPVVEIENVRVDVFRQLLTFIYTDHCDMLTVGKIINFCEDIIPELQRSADIEMAETIISNGHRKSAFEVHQSHNKQGKGGKKAGGKGSKGKKSNPEASAAAKNPIKLLQDTAKRFGVKTLIKKLEAVRYVDGTIESIPGWHISTPNLKFYRTNYCDLYDVCILASDGVTIPCHKCILVARLEYFRSMLASGWIETTSTESLSLPVPGDILQVIIDFLYVDDSSIVKGSMDAEFLCNVLVLADQLLIFRLVDLCQVAIASLISLRNACDLLEFATLYNSTQLKVTCQQFITINLAALLESRSLDVLSDAVIEELTEYYKDTVPRMSRRCITPYHGWPDLTYLEQLEAKHTNQELPQSATTMATTSHDHRKVKAKRRRPRTKSSGDDVHEKKTTLPDQRPLPQHPTASILGSEPQGSEPSGPGDLEGLERPERPERQTSISSDSGFVLELDDISESPTDSPRLEPETQAAQIPVYTQSCWGPIRVRVPAELPTHCTPTLNQHNLAPNQRVSALNQHALAQTIHVTPPDLPMNGVPQTPTLRDIMAQQEAVARSNTKPDSTPSSAKKAGRHKDRRRKSSHSESVDEAMKGEGAKPKARTPPVNPWGSVAPVVQSFKDLMLTEDPVSMVSVDKPTSQHPRPLAGHSKHSGSHGDTTLSWGLQLPGLRRSHKEPAQITTKQQSGPTGSQPAPKSPCSPASPSDNPWQKVPSKPLTRQSLSFTDIVEDEILQERTLERATRKPLALIQIEERAIQELLLMYEADKAQDEHITVERVYTLQATPTWAATQRHRDS